MADYLKVTEAEVRHAVAYALLSGRSFGWTDTQISEHATSSLVDRSSTSEQDRPQVDWETWIEGGCTGCSA